MNWFVDIKPVAPLLVILFSKTLSWNVEKEKQWQKLSLFFNLKNITEFLFLKKHAMKYLPMQEQM